VKRDIAERGRDLKGVIDVCYVPAFSLFPSFEASPQRRLLLVPGVVGLLWRPPAHAVCRPHAQQYNTFVKPAFDTFIFPTIKHADVVLPRGADNLGTQVRRFNTHGCFAFAVHSLVSRDFQYLPITFEGLIVC
jgi:hypothetical protein